MFTYQEMGLHTMEIVQFNSFYLSCHNHTPGLFSFYLFWSENVLNQNIQLFSNCRRPYCFPILKKKVFVVGVNWPNRVHLDKQL